VTFPSSSGPGSRSLSGTFADPRTRPTPACSLPCVPTSTTRAATSSACSRSTRPVCAPTSTLPAHDPGPAQGADPNYTFSPDEPADHAIGRSRGGLTTKIHALSDEMCSLITVQLTAGQAGDNPMLWLDQNVYRPTTLRRHRRPPHLRREHHRNRNQQLPPRPRPSPTSYRWGQIKPSPRGQIGLTQSPKVPSPWPGQPIARIASSKVGRQPESSTSCATFRGTRTGSVR